MLGYNQKHLKTPTSEMLKSVNKFLQIEVFVDLS